MRFLTMQLDAATHEVATLARGRGRGAVLALVVALLALPRPAGAIILYKAGVGFRQPEFFLVDERTVPVAFDISEFSFGGALCPAPGTPNFLCGRLLSEAGLAGGRLFLRSAALFERTDADPAFRETAAYADTNVLITSMGGFVGTAPQAAFYFGLSGTLSQSASDPAVLVQSFAVARLQAGSGGGVQCFGVVDCPIDHGPYEVVVTNWEPSLGFSLNLRSDVAAVAPFGTPGGWDAEVVADFADTLEVLAIQVRDANGDPMPGVVLTALDAKGDPLVTFPNEPEGVPEPAHALLGLTGGVVLAAAGRRRAVSASTGAP